MEKRDFTNSRQQLTIEQVKQLLSTAQQPLKTMLTVAITTGLRRGELLGLHWQDIDMDGGTVSVHRFVTGTSEREATETARTIAVSPMILLVLKEHQRYQEKESALAGEAWQDLGLVFPNERGQYFNPREIWQRYHALFVATGHPHMSFHDLRHITVTLFMQMGINVRVIQAILGFRYGSTSLTTVTPVSLSMQKEAMKKWDALFEGS